MTTESAATVRGSIRLFRSGFADPEEVESNIELMISAQKRLDVRATGPGSVLIIHGANENVLAVGGQTVGRIRRELGGLFNIPPGAEAIVGGHPVGEDYSTQHGERLEFIEPVGRKGVGRVWTGEEFCALFRMSEIDLRAMIARGLPVLRMTDGSTRLTETQVDRFLDDLSVDGANPAATASVHHDDAIVSLVAEVRRIADVMDPPPPDIVDSGYVAGRLGCTTTWVADLARRGTIPPNCLVEGTGDGKPWKFRRGAIDLWIASR